MLQGPYSRTLWQNAYLNLYEGGKGGGSQYVLQFKYMVFYILREIK